MSLQPGRTMVIGPLNAPAGTVAVIWVGPSIVNDALTLFVNFTVLTPVKFAPVITTALPKVPVEGLIPLTRGQVTTVYGSVCKSPQPVLAMVIGPLTAPAGTVAVICVALLIVNEVVTLLLNLTDVTPVRLVPVITTLLPAGPIAGLRFVTVGQATTVKLEV